ncbi:hypothetical protein B0H11DRAFT_2186260 [Mycena galericulata]|nr:hypothetical protein B0H11DRAFT_2186260 [Mycena galericulata]
MPRVLYTVTVGSQTFDVGKPTTDVLQSPPMAIPMEHGPSSFYTPQRRRTQVNKSTIFDSRMRLTLLWLFLSPYAVSAWNFAGMHSSPTNSRAAPTFNADQQRVDITGAHKFTAAGPSDFRGPCPGLNTLANHNYIPHNGIVTLVDAIVMSVQVFGLGIDSTLVAAALALYAVDLLDPLLRFSIGGPPAAGGILGLPILGGPAGLSGTHNEFESDCSPTRQDLYATPNPDTCGDNYSVRPEFFQDLLDVFARNQSTDDQQSKFDFANIGLHHARRFEHSVQNNPYFFRGPVEMLASSLVHVLVPGVMSNHSVEHPSGFISAEGLASLYGMGPGSDGKLQYNRGTEQFPENWYRRPDDYLLAITDMADVWLAYPETLSIGGNINGTNTFSPLNLGDLTGGLLNNTASFAEGNNAACFLFQAVQAAILSPLNIVEGIFSGILTQVSKQLGLQALIPACPQLEGQKLSLLEQYPGYKRKTNATCKPPTL